MALTILQEPTSPNVSNTNLIYTISSSNVPQYQFRYIADLYESGSSTRLARFKYPQNSSGTANIDLARPIGDYLDYDYNWTINNIDNSSSNYKEFEIKFGEEYGTSYSSSVTTFENEASSSIYVLKGNIQYPTVSDYESSTNTKVFNTSSINWFSDYYYGEISPTFPDRYIYDSVLSNNPNLMITPPNAKYNDSSLNIDIGTTWWQDGYDSGSNWYVAQPIGTNDKATESYLPFNTNSSYGIQVYNDNNELILDVFNNFTSVDSNVSLALPVGLSQLSAMTDTGNALYSSSLQISSSAQWNWYVVVPVIQQVPSFISHFYYNEDKGSDTLMSLDSGSTSGNYIWNPDSSVRGTIAIKPSMWHNKVYPTNCNNEKTRFAFINSFGVWDYYNVYMPTRRVTNIDRKIYEQDRINLNDRIASYNVSNRGEKQYYTEYTDDFEITTDVIDSQESQWLREMFESSEVFIQSGSDFIPINILNNRETIINTTARNKNYQYTIRYQFSNLREPR